MMDVESSYSDFINCDRTGRRNAVPDIKGDKPAVGTSELTKDMAELDLKAGGPQKTVLPGLLPPKRRPQVVRSKETKEHLKDDEG